jgi:hypothetical protein
MQKRIKLDCGSRSRETERKLKQNKLDANGKPNGKKKHAREAERANSRLTLFFGIPVKDLSHKPFKAFGAFAMNMEVVCVKTTCCKDILVPNASKATPKSNSPMQGRKYARCKGLTSRARPCMIYEQIFPPWLEHSPYFINKRPTVVYTAQDQSGNYIIETFIRIWQANWAALDVVYSQATLSRTPVGLWRESC